MSRVRFLTSVAVVSLGLAVITPPAHAVEIDLVIGGHGATFLPWDATHETGNGYGVTAGINVLDFRVLAGLGGILPASRPTGHFGIVWIEGQWHPLRHLFAEWGLPLSPYVVAGVGVGMPDALADSEDPVPPNAVRWTGDEAQVVGLAGLGFIVGEFDGFFVGVDMRIYNAAFGGFTVSAGYGF